MEKILPMSWYISWIQRSPERSGIPSALGGQALVQHGRKSSTFGVETLNSGAQSEA